MLRARTRRPRLGNLNSVPECAEELQSPASHPCRVRVISRTLRPAQAAARRRYGSAMHRLHVRSSASPAAVLVRAACTSSPGVPDDQDDHRDDGERGSRRAPTYVRRRRRRPEREPAASSPTRRRRSSPGELVRPGRRLPTARRDPLECRPRRGYASAWTLGRRPTAVHDLDGDGRRHPDRLTARHDRRAREPKLPGPSVRSAAPRGEHHLMILMTLPEPTVRPPSRMAKPRPSSIAMGWMRFTWISVLSPGMTISVPSGSVMTPVTSVVRK